MNPSPGARLALLLLAAMPAGCASPVIVASAGLAAAQTGTTAYINGELESAQIARMETMYRAAMSTMNDLKFKVIMSKVSKNSAYIFAEEVTGRSIKIFLERKSPTVTKTNIRVGVFGDQAVARLIMGELQARAPAIPAAEPVEDDEPYEP